MDARHQAGGPHRAGAEKKIVPRPVCLPAAHEGSAKSVDDGGGESASSRAFQELPNSCFSTDYNKTSIHEYSAATIKTMGHLPGDGQVHRETFPVILTGSAILAVRTREVLRPLARPPKPSLRFCKESSKIARSRHTCGNFRDWVMSLKIVASHATSHRPSHSPRPRERRAWRHAPKSSTVCCART